MHDEACRWEHVISEDVERRLVELLGHPDRVAVRQPDPGPGGAGRDRGDRPFRDGNEQLQEVVRRQSAPIQVVIERMSEEIQKDVAMMGTLREAGIRPGAEVSAEVGGLGVRLTAEGSPSCEIDRLASTHLFVSGSDGLLSWSPPARRSPRPSAPCCAATGTTPSLALLDEAVRAGEQSVPSADLSRARELAEVARRVLDLDAEDFTAISRQVDAPWTGRLAESSFPAQPRDPIRGALGSLVPLYELMLEVLQIRAVRREPLQVVVTAHLIGEYLVQLAWESTLGHGRRPAAAGCVRREQPVGERGPGLPALLGPAQHRPPGPERLLRRRRRLHDLPRPVPLPARRGLRGVRARTRRRRPRRAARRGRACPQPVRLRHRLGRERRRDLDAADPAGPALHRLADRRAAAPRSGRALLRRALGGGDLRGLAATWEKVSAPWPDGANPVVAPTLEARTPAGEALPGLSALVSAVAGRPVGPGRLLRDIGNDVARALDGSEQDVGREQGGRDRGGNSTRSRA